jgi:hypothetical protein
MNIYIANVPGPPVPLYLAGAPLLEVFPVVPIMGTFRSASAPCPTPGSSTSPWSRTRAAAPDAPVFTEGLRAALDALTHAAPVPS